MRIDILTLFPEMFGGPFDHSIIKRAKEKGLVEIFIHDLRQWSTDKYKSVDDRPYGGGPGMVMRVDIIDKALEAIGADQAKATTKRVLMDASGKEFDHQTATEYAKLERLVLVCGHYEGVDYRVRDQLIDEAISVGKYVLSGGELPAMTITDAVVRLINGVLGNPDSLNEESFTKAEPEYPQYTRPAEYKGWKVPEVLLGGNHQDISAWRKGKVAKR